MRDDRYIVKNSSGIPVFNVKSENFTREDKIQILLRHAKLLIPWKHSCSANIDYFLLNDKTSMNWKCPNDKP